MATNSISRVAWAKINLDLLIVGQRDDGYHLLDSLVVFANYGDEITVQPAQYVNLKVTGPFADDLTGEENNIVLRAVTLLQKKFDIQQGAEIELVKNLPVSSGIGGGSADAAAIIHVLLSLWNIDAHISELDDLVLTLGADVPACMVSETMRMSGIGEKLFPINIKIPIYLLLINPRVSVSTETIFKARALRKACFSPMRRIPDEITSISQLEYILSNCRNDLEFDACVAEPIIKTTLEEIQNNRDCIVAGMSGSGATCFGIYSSFEAAHKQSIAISCNYPNWWVKSVKVR